MLEFLTRNNSKGLKDQIKCTDIAHKVGRIGVLTYQSLHKKTSDTLLLLKLNGYNKVEVYAMPFSYIKKFQPIYNHRPEFLKGEELDTKTLCKRLGYQYTDINSYEDIRHEGVFLVCGAGILPKNFIEKNIVINAHPGYIPNCRGLDALKWAIIEDEPIGVTTHLIGDYIDAGEIIERNVIKIMESDTFYSLARRVYDAEINMLVSAIDKIEEEHTFTDGEGYIVHKRMPHIIERNLISRFEDRKQKELPESIDNIY